MQYKKLYKVYLSTGTNMGDRRLNLLTAQGLINLKIGLVIACSSTYQTAAWGVEEQADFYNQVLLANTTLSPENVLREISEIEQFMGRERKRHWGERIIDIDILYYDENIVDKPDLKIPHPYIQARNFVLIPLKEIAPDFVHPVLNLSSQQLLEQSKDTATVCVVE